eukprot:scaffold3.g6256.t1
MPLAMPLPRPPGRPAPPRVRRPPRPAHPQQERPQYLYHFVLHAALDSVEEQEWGTSAMHLGVVDRFNNYQARGWPAASSARERGMEGGGRGRGKQGFGSEEAQGRGARADRAQGRARVSAYTTASHVRFLLLHDGRGDELVKSFFRDVYELYLRVMLNPFFTPTTRITSLLFHQKPSRMTTPRRLLITVRTGHGVAGPDLFGDKTYVVIEVEGKCMTSGVTRATDENPVWSEVLAVELAPPRAGAPPPSLLAKVWRQVPLLPDRLLASGTTLLTDGLYAGGRQEVTVPLHDRTGKEAGHLHLGLEIERAVPIVGSAAGKLISEGVLQPRSEAAASPRAAGLPATAPVTPLSDALVGGGLSDPSKPAYGVML